MAQRIPLDKIEENHEAQPRESINVDVVNEYAEALQTGGAVFPPVVMFFDGARYWLADGFHRVRAYRQVGFKQITAHVQRGDLRDAILYSCGSNAEHGLRRTNEDKRRAVAKLLRDPKWSKWSDREIARRAAVSNRFVSTLRREVSVNGSQMPAQRTVARNGSIYDQNTANIGSATRAINRAVSEAQADKPFPRPNENGVYRTADADHIELTEHATVYVLEIESGWISSYSAEIPGTGVGCGSILSPLDARSIFVSEDDATSYALKTIKLWVERSLDDGSLSKKNQKVCRSILEAIGRQAKWLPPESGDDKEPSMRQLHNLADKVSGLLRGLATLKTKPGEFNEACLPEDRPEVTRYLDGAYEWIDGLMQDWKRA